MLQDISVLYLLKNPGKDLLKNHCFDKILSSTTIFNVDNCKKYFLSIKSANDFCRII